MASTTDQLRALLDDTAFRALELLAGASSPVSGRALARSLMVSPTTASAALARLKRAGFVAATEVGRATTWYLDASNATMRSWLEEAHGGTSVGGSTERPQLTAVIFTALQLEYAAIVAHLPERRSARVGTTRFEAGTFAGDRAEWNIYMAEIGAGNASAAIQVTSAAALKPHLVLFVGVAGSVKPDDLSRGDVVVAERVYNIHAGKDAWSEEEGSVHRARPLSYPAAYGAVQLARSVRQTNWISEFSGARPGAEALNAKGGSPRVEIRAIAAGEVVHGDNGSQLMSKVRNQLNDAAAVDMESFGVYEAAHVSDLPALAVRGISDCIGDKQANTDVMWQPRAASHAAAFAFALLRKAEPADFQRPGAQVSPGGVPPAGVVLPPREMLFRLPPPVAVVYEWALPSMGGRATGALGELVALRGQPATWLSRFRHRPPTRFKGDDSGPLWVLVAEFADAHEHPTASWLYKGAADRSKDGLLRAFLYSRAAIAARRDHGPREAEGLLARAEAEAPAGRLLWEHHRFGLRSDAEAVLAATPLLASALDLHLSQPVLDAMGMANTDLDDDDLTAFVEEFAERHPALLEQVRLTVMFSAASALQMTGQLNAAQLLLEGLAGGLSAYGGGQPSVSALGWLVGSRSSTVLLQIARNLCMRVANPSTRGVGFDRDATLARAEELTMTARDRLLDWGGPTGNALAVAAQARAATGDVRGALRLLLPAPLGAAGAAEATSQPAVQVAAELAVGIGNVELALKLAAKIQDPVERRLATALALTLRRNSHPEAAAEYRSALSEPTISARADQQIRAFHGLAMVAELSSEEVTRLEGIDPETADLIRAQSFLTAGRTSEAQILARRYDSDAALQIRVAGLVNQGKTTEAISALETHAARHGGERFLLQAAVIALSSGVTSEASRLAARVASSIDPSRRRAGREILIDAALRREDWEAVLGETRRLLDDEAVAKADPDRDANIRKYRWALAQALHQLRRMQEAYQVIRAEPRLVPANLGQARLVVSILRTIAHLAKEISRPEGEPESGVTQAEVLSVAAEAAQAFPEDEELVATAVMTAFSMPAAEPPDPLLMTKARQLQQQYFGNFPDGKLIRSVPIDDDLTGVREILRTELAPNAEMVEQMRRGAMLGQIPISVVTSMLQRSYAEALVCNSIGCYVISSSDDRIIAEEMAAARNALDGTVVIDTSALFLAPVVLGGITELRARFERLLVAAPQRDDILAARASLAMRIAGSLGWDPASKRPTIVQYDKKLTERWASESERLAAALELCEILGDLPHDGDPRNRAWTSPIRLARERGAYLVADDVALRAAARSEGIAAFGSLQLLAALVADGLMLEDALEDSYRRLMEIRAAELPVFARLLDIAEEEGWKPTGYAAFLFTRPSTWNPLSDGWQTYMRLIRALPAKVPDEVAGWCTSAAFGLSLITPPQTLPVAAAAIVVWTMLEMRDPVALPVLLTNAERVVGQFVHGADLLKQVVQQLAITIRQVTPPELVAPIVLRLLAGLDGEAHTQALSYFFTMP